MTLGDYSFNLLCSLGSDGLLTVHVQGIMDKLCPRTPSLTYNSRIFVGVFTTYVGRYGKTHIKFSNKLILEY